MIRRRVHLPVVRDEDDDAGAELAAADPAPPAPHTYRRTGGRMGLGEARSIAGALGHPSKMPGFSYGLDARRCRVGSELAPQLGSVCNGCYARKDFYGSWSPVAKGHSRRHDGLEHPDWVEAMVTLISHHCRGEDRWFRWHDSGDIQSPEHLERIAEVCRRTPGVEHWLPTREYADVAEFLRRGHAIPENLCIRLSAHWQETEVVLPPELAPILAGLPTSTVHVAAPVMTGKGNIECRAVELRDNKCGDCRACWTPTVTNVSYPLH